MFHELKRLNSVDIIINWPLLLLHLFRGTFLNQFFLLAIVLPYSFLINSIKKKKKKKIQMHDFPNILIMVISKQILQPKWKYV